MKRLIEKLARDFPNSDLTMSVEVFADWLAKQQLEEPAPHGAKLCPVCCDHRLVNFRTAKHEAFDKPGYRHCSGCGTDIPWHLDEGQPPLLGSNRATAKTEKGNG